MVTRRTRKEKTGAVERRREAEKGERRERREVKVEKREMGPEKTNPWEMTCSEDRKAVPILL